MDLTPRQLVELGLDAVDGAAPAALRARVLSAAAMRPRPAWDGERGVLNSQAAFMRTAAELGRLLDELGPQEWTAPTGVQESSVYDLVRHLVGVERYVLGQLGERARLDAPSPHDHFRVSGMAAADLTGADFAELARAWWREVMTTIAATSRLGPDHAVSFHHLHGDVRSLLLIRTFEVWTHEEDIRRATGRPLNELDGERLALMSSDLMRILPAGMALAGTARPGRSARLRLTGVGGTEFVVALAPDEEPGQPEVTITADAAELCRLAANRVGVRELVVEVDGDISLLEPVLVGASAFALD